MSTDLGPALTKGSLCWVYLDPVRGREQGGRRPVVVVANTDYLATVTQLAIVVPVTTRDRGWPNHVRIDSDAGLESPSWAMAEQPRTIDRARIVSVVGQVSAATIDAIDFRLRAFLH